MLFLRKKNHFIKDYYLINVMNQRKFNVLQTIFVKKKFLKKVKNESNFLKIITNDEYYRIDNMDKNKFDEVKSKKHLLKKNDEEN